MKTLILVSLMFFSSVVFAARDTSWVDAKTLIEVQSYDAKSDTYEIVVPGYQGQGPIITTPEDLVKAIPTLSLKRVEADPSSVVKNQYTIDKKLVYLMPEAVAKRKAKLSPDSKKPKK